MAGLPRSGSTLISSILSQNPKIHSGPSSPVTGIMWHLENFLLNDELFLANPKQEQMGNLISSVILHHYSDIEKEIIIDKNRSWVSRPNYIQGYLGTEPKIIVPVRKIDEILASFIAMHRRNPIDLTIGKINFIDRELIKRDIPLTDENRCAWIAGPEGILGQSINAIRELLVSGNQNILHFVDYEDLMNSPKETIDAIYDFIGEEHFEHDFENIENLNKERDEEVYGFADMHDVRSSLGRSGINPEDYLSEQVIQACVGMNFWKDLEPIQDFQEDQDEINSMYEQSQESDLDEDDSVKTIGA